MESNKLHLTLIFIGDLEKQDIFKEIKNSKGKKQISKEKLKIEKIKKALTYASQTIKPFKLSFKGLGCFPDYNWPRVIWLGLKGDLQTLAKIQKKLYDRLVKLGFRLEKRPFKGHITLGRIKNEAKLKHRQEIGRQLKALRQLDFKSELTVNKVVLYESKLSPKGSIYINLLEASLLK